MNPPKCSVEDYINFVIASPKQLTATEAARVQPESRNAPAHYAFTRLLQRLEPNADQLWRDAGTQINKETGILVLEDSTLDKPFSKHNALASRHWSGKHKAVVYGINLITLLLTDGKEMSRLIIEFLIKAQTAKPKTIVSRKCFWKLINADFLPLWFVLIVGILLLRI